MTAVYSSLKSFGTHLIHRQPPKAPSASAQDPILDDDPDGVLIDEEEVKRECAALVPVKVFHRMISSAAAPSTPLTPAIPPSTPSAMQAAPTEAARPVLKLRVPEITSSPLPDDDFDSIFVNERGEIERVGPEQGAPASSSNGVVPPSASVATFDHAISSAAAAATPSTLATSTAMQVVPAEVKRPLLKSKVFEITSPPPRETLTGKVCGAVANFVWGNTPPAPNPIDQLQERLATISGESGQLAFLNMELTTTPESNKWQVLYVRCQYRIKAGDYIGALKDIKESIEQHPTPESLYFKANLLAFRDKTPLYAKAYFIFSHIMAHNMTTHPDLAKKCEADRLQIVEQLKIKAQQLDNLSTEEVCILAKHDKSYHPNAVERLCMENLSVSSSLFLKLLINSFEQNKEPCNVEKMHFAIGFLYQQLIETIEQEKDQGIPQLSFCRNIKQFQGKMYAQFLAAAKAGYAKAQRAVGECFIEGEVIAQNIDFAFEYIKKAADQGDVLALDHLAYSFYVNDSIEYQDGHTKTNPKLAAQCLQKAFQLCTKNQREALLHTLHEWKQKRLDDPHGNSLQLQALDEFEKLVRTEKRAKAEEHARSEKKRVLADIGNIA